MNLASPRRTLIDEFRWIARRSSSGAIVLLYHRVTDLAFDPQWLCVTPDQFAQHLQVIHDKYRPLRLDELRDRMEQRKLPRNAVVVTFDDGYADNVCYAKPLLEKYDVPATVFVVTGKIENQTEFWWDELDNILFRPEILPNQLALSVNGTMHKWMLADASGDHSNSPPDLRWTVASDFCPTDRHKIYKDLSGMLRPQGAEVRDSILGELAKWAGVRRESRHTHRTMRVDEISQLAANGLIDVGAHTVTHPLMSSCSLEAQKQEIEQSKNALENILGRRVAAFSYPFGTRADYSAETVSLVRSAGFRSACSNFPGHVRQMTDPFQLPRHLVRGCSGDEFVRQLRVWFAG